MRMQSFFGPAFLGLALALVSVDAQAVEMVLTIEDTSNLGISIDGGGLGSGNGSAGANGTITVDVDGGNLTVVSSDINVDDITTTGSGTLGVLNINDVHSILVSTAPAADEGGGVFNLEGWTLTLDNGTVVIPGLGNLEAFNFANQSVDLELPEVLSTLDTGAGTWDIPVNAVVTFSTLNNTVTVTVSGELNLVPEPGAPLLVAAGLAVGLFLTQRKRRAA